MSRIGLPSRRSLQRLILLLLCFAIVTVQAQTGTTSSARPTHTGDEDDEDRDEDGEDGPPDHQSSSSHRSSSTSGSPSPTRTDGGSPSASSATADSGGAHHGLSGGAITGIIFGVLIFILLVAAILLYLWRRRKRLLAARADSGDGSQVNTALISNTPISVQPNPSSRPTSNSLDPMTYAAVPITAATNGHRRMSSSAAYTLPNPFETTHRNIPPQSTSPTSPTSPISPVTSLTSRTSVQLDRQLPPLPDGSGAVHSTSRTSGTFDALSIDPSSYQQSTLSRVPESENGFFGAGPSTVATDSEAVRMAEYQKRLELHHQKESEDAMRNTGAIPTDPPPEYRAVEDDS